MVLVFLTISINADDLLCSIIIMKEDNQKEDSYWEVNIICGNLDKSMNITGNVKCDKQSKNFTLVTEQVEKKWALIEDTEYHQVMQNVKPERKLSMRKDTNSCTIYIESIGIIGFVGIISVLLTLLFK